MFTLNQGEVCTCPGRAMVHEPIYDRFMEKAVARFEAMIQGKPPPRQPCLATTTRCVCSMRDFRPRRLGRDLQDR